jgi:hypothetical protein
MGTTTTRTTAQDRRGIEDALTADLGAGLVEVEPVADYYIVAWTREDRGRNQWGTHIAYLGEDGRWHLWSGDYSPDSRIAAIRSLVERAAGKGKAVTRFDHLLTPAPTGYPGAETDTPDADHGPDLGDLVVVLLASTLAGLRDRLTADGFPHAADLVSRLTDTTDAYLRRDH